MDKRVNSDTENPHAGRILSTTIGFVKYQGRHASQSLERRKTEKPSQDHRHLEKVVAQYDQHTKLLQSFAIEHETLLAEIESLRDENKRLLAANDADTDNTILTPEDIEGLPEELIEQLSITEADRQDFDLLAVAKEIGGHLSLDKLLVGYYRKTKQILDRTKLNQRVYRMVQKGMLYAVPGRKGVYSALPQEDTAQQDDLLE